MKLVANKVSKWFLRAREGSNKFFALNENDFELNPGELTVLYGQSGSGKSTLLNILSGLLTPGTGKVIVGETDIHAKNSKNYKEMEERARELLRKTGIEELENVMPAELSGGELRRMAISRALINNPEFILADEPTSDLDDENTEIVLEMFKSLANEGKSVLVITHDKEVFKFADRIFEMKSGNILDKNQNIG